MAAPNSLARTFKTLTLGALATVVPAASAQAGMTVYGLRDIYRLRLEEISFFLVVLVGCAFLTKVLWNHAFKSMPAVPKLKLLPAVCLALLFGMAMLLILTMISGIREVLTPEAWRHQGTTYRLNASAQEPMRKRSLEHLRIALFEYARMHDGRFPAHDFVPELADKLWESPDQQGSHYVYSGGLTTNDTSAVLALEPANFGDRRFALMVSGEIKTFARTDLEGTRIAKPSP